MLFFVEKTSIGAIGAFEKFNVVVNPNRMTGRKTCNQCKLQEDDCKCERKGSQV